MSHTVVEKAKARAKKKFEKRLVDLNKTEWVLDRLPDPIDSEWMPNVFIVGIKQLPQFAALTWGGWSGTDKKFKDTEVSILMQQYPPLPMAMIKDNSRAFRPIDQAEWARLMAGEGHVLSIGDEARSRLLNVEPRRWESNVVPVAPFIMVSWFADYGLALFVEWYTEIEGKIIHCKVYLNLYPAAWEIDRNHFRNVTKSRFLPNIGGAYQEIKWWSVENTSRRTIYWPFPEEGSLSWGNVIDYGPRNEARE